MRGIRKIDIGFLLLRQGFDLRIVILQPLPHERLVALDCSVQRLLAGDAELRQETAYRIGAQFYAELILDKLGHHLAGPQRKFKFQLQRVLPGHPVVDPQELLAIEFWRSPEKWLRLQRAPATAPVIREPPVDCCAPNADYSRHHFWAFTFLHAPHCAFAQCFQSRVIQLAGVILSHAMRESRAIHAVNKMFSYL